MSFTEALQSAYQRYFECAGRASRAEQAYFGLYCLAGLGTFALVDGAVFGASLGLPPLTLIFFVVTIVPFITVMFRRLHDTNRSGWWMLAACVPVLGWLTLMYFFTQPGSSGVNAYGPEPLDLSQPTDFGATPAE
ncbi:MAG: DUF805 domain-containing protein [Pseudomonadota bacterium]